MSEKFHTENYIQNKKSFTNKKVMKIKQEYIGMLRMLSLFEKKLFNICGGQIKMGHPVLC